MRIVAVGTGNAIKLAERGDADILFVHHPPSERKFVKEGYGVKRYPVMYNDFVVLGPIDDPARVFGAKTIEVVLQRIKSRQQPFISRGDNSGTNKKEMALWKSASIEVKPDSGTWYRETGSGMGATLNVASGMNAYTLSDRATWLNFKNKKNLTLLFEGDTKLFNQYGIILVNPNKFPHIKKNLGQAFINWIISREGQMAIKGFKIGEMQAFFPNATQIQN